MAHKAKAAALLPLVGALALHWRLPREDTQSDVGLCTSRALCDGLRLVECHVHVVSRSSSSS